MFTDLRHPRQLALAHSELKSQMLERTMALQNLSQRLLKVQDEERRKLSRDLHDSTGQTLVALKLQVSLLEQKCQQDPSAMALAGDIASLADQALAEIRTMSYLLHPPLLDEVGFVCAAKWYVEGFAKRSGIVVAAAIAESHERLPNRMEIVLFRVLQESLTNVHRHSGALEASVSFQHQDERVILEVRDFGQGIPAARLGRLRQANGEAGVGLAGMRERLEELNGRLDMESDAGGTRVRAIVPLYAAALAELVNCGQIAPGQAS